MKPETLNVSSPSFPIEIENLPSSVNVAIFLKLPKTESISVSLLTLLIGISNSPY